MYVRWQLVFPKCPTAVLVESARVNGKPRQRHIAYLGKVDHRAMDDKNYLARRGIAGYGAHYRAWWWYRISKKLDALANRVLPDDRRKVEAALAREVPRPTAEEVATYDLRCQADMRSEHGECPGCYLGWPEGLAGVPPRPPKPPESERWANVIAAITGRG